MQVKNALLRTYKNCLQKKCKRIYLLVVNSYIKEKNMPLVTMRQILDHAAENNYGVPAFNINDMEQIIAVLPRK